LKDTTSKYNPYYLPPAESLSSHENLKLLSINEARKILGIRYETMKNLIEDGLIRHLNLNGKIKIPFYELKNYIEANLNNSKIDTENSEDKMTTRINQLFQKFN
jgi:excisionase family DNA binding protein